MHDLKDVTNNVHYENFRYRNLASVSGDGVKVRSGSSSSSTNSKYVISIYHCFYLSICSQFYYWQCSTLIYVQDLLS